MGMRRALLGRVKGSTWDSRKALTGWVKGSTWELDGECEQDHNIVTGST